MSKFIPIITNEAMDKICYKGGGWDITPYAYAVSSTDILADITRDDAFEENAKRILKEITKTTYNADTNIWYSCPFTYVTKVNDESLVHRIVIPTNALSSGSKDIKTIYFLYKNKHTFDEIFLYAIAYVKDIEEIGKGILYEAGTIKSYFFTFSVSTNKNLNNFYLDYSYPELIELHNLSDIHNLDSDKKEVHEGLLARDGSRNLTGLLNYKDNKTFTEDNQLVSKEYVDNQIAILKSYNNLR